jgi:hypothetical protein
MRVQLKPAGGALEAPGQHGAQRCGSPAVEFNFSIRHGNHSVWDCCQFLFFGPRSLYEGLRI